MHSCETVPAPPATGPSLLLQLGRLIVRARSSSPHRPAPPPSTRDRLLHAKLLASKPSTSHQVLVQPKVEEEPKNESALEEQLSNHVLALWNEQIPVCIEVLLAPDCKECYTSLMRTEEEGSYDKMHCQQRALLLERWTMRALTNKGHESPAMISPQWLLNAVRSQLHFSQLSAWIARLKNATCDHNPNERRRKLSREKCNIKKLEANCDDNELPDETRKLNIVYSIKIPGESYKMAEFTKPPNDHTFPITEIGSDVYLKMIVESLPRTEEIPAVFCTCRRRKTSKETVVVAPTHEDLVVKLNDLTINPNVFTTDPKAINSNSGTPTRLNLGPSCSKYYQDQHECGKVLDDRMHTICKENGKHKCNCDEESDGKEQRSSNSLSEPKKLDERRLKEIAKYKRRLRKESKLKKLSDSTSSEGDGMQKTYHPTSIPILQAARFDRLRAIGCYRNQTYLTLPATRIESKSPFAETISLPPKEYQKKTSSIGTQTENLSCQCGNPLQMSCEGCKGMVRSEATYDLASIYKNSAKTDETGARRKREEIQTSSKKHKCDNNISSNKKCDIRLDDNLDDSFNDEFIKRPKLRRFLAIEDRLERVAMDRRNSVKDQDRSDAQILNLQSDDTVFSKPVNTKRQKTVSIDDDEYVLYEKCCDFGSFDKCDTESPKDEDQGDFQFPDPRRDGQENPVPSPTEMDRFRWRFDSAASMVFHTKTGLPLTSSPAPLRRGNNCFDFDDSINGISGIKSALFHPISPPSPSATPASPPATFVPRSRSPPARSPRPHRQNKLKIGPTTGLLGSFEESALKGRLEPVATVHGFTAELGASGAFCPPHKKLPVTVFFYAPGGTNAPYMGHIALGPGGYRVPRSGTVQVSLLNPHGTLVKMFVVLYELTGMPPLARTFLRQRTLYMPAGGTSARPPPAALHKWLRYLIHLRFMTSKSGKLYLHTDIRILVSRKADLDTATAHSAIFKPIPTNTTDEQASSTNQNAANPPNRAPNRVFGGCSEFDAEFRNEMREIGYENQNGVSYELRSFTYAPENPKYSPR